MSDIDRRTIRRPPGTSGLVNNKNAVLFLYGKLDLKSNAKIYCTLHKCYLSSQNIKEKKCNYKKCKFRKEID